MQDVLWCLWTKAEGALAVGGCAEQAGSVVIGMVFRGVQKNSPTGFMVHRGSPGSRSLFVGTSRFP